MLHDIFSFRRKKKPKKKEPLKITIDHREKNSLVPAHLKKQGFEIEFKQLKVADYLVKDVAVERKTVSDFISSMINRRLLKQLEELQQYKNKLLIVEGIDEQDLYTNSKNKTGMHPNSIRGFLLSITLQHKIPLIFTKNAEDTAIFLTLIAKKQDREMSFRATKKTLNKKEQLQFIVEGFPGIGPKTARKLLKKYKTLKKLLNTTEKDLKEVLGKKSEAVFKIINQKY
jgi:ERCC4-type nuclease